MAALSTRALSGAGEKPVGTDAQGGGLQSQTAGGHLGSAKRLVNTTQKQMNGRMKTKNHDDSDRHQSIFAAARCRRDHSISKTTTFADISFRVVICFHDHPG